jgi:tetratricopeptide (TPR) repeat protein
MELADCLGDENKLVEADSYLREALASARKFATNKDERVRLETVLTKLVELTRREGNLAEAEVFCREAVALKQQRVGRDARDVAALLAGLGSILSEQGKTAEAETTFREAAAMANKTAGKDHPQDAAQALYGLAWVLKSESKSAEAESVSRQALALRQQLPPAPGAQRAIADSYFQLGSILWSQGKLVEADSSARDALALYEKTVPRDCQTFKCLTMIAGILGSENKRSEEELILRQGITRAKLSLSNDHQEDLAQALYDLAWVLQIENKLTEAEAAARDALAIRRNLEAAGHQGQDVADSFYELAVVLQSEQAWAQAEATACECLTRYEKNIPNEWPTFNCRSTLGLILTAEGNYAEAEPLLLSAYEGLSHAHVTFVVDLNARVRECLERLVRLYQAILRPDQVAVWQRKLTDLDHPMLESSLHP